MSVRGTPLCQNEGLREMIGRGLGSSNEPWTDIIS